jgi:hypothetical protein
VERFFCTFSIIPRFLRENTIFMRLVRELGGPDAGARRFLAWLPAWRNADTANHSLDWIWCGLGAYIGLLLMDGRDNLIYAAACRLS